MRYYIIFSFICFSPQGVCQLTGLQSLQFLILDDTIKVDSNHPETVVDYSITDISTNNLICYRLSGPIGHSDTRDSTRYCDQEKTSAGIIVFIFDEASKWISGTHWMIGDYSRPMTAQRADSSMAIAKSDWLTATVVLKKDETRVFNQLLDLRPFNLLPGTYFAQLLYYSGRRVDNFVTGPQQDDDRNNYEAEVFQGCVMSNKIVLSVK